MSFRTLFTLGLGFIFFSNASEGACRRGQCGGGIFHRVQRVVKTVMDSNDNEMVIVCRRGCRRQKVVTVPREIQSDNGASTKPSQVAETEENKKPILKEFCVATLEKQAQATKAFGGSSKDEKEGANQVLERLSNLKKEESFIKAKSGQDRLHQFLESISASFSGATNDLPNEIVDLRKELKKFKSAQANQNLSDIGKKTAQMEALTGAVESLVSHGGTTGAQSFQSKMMGEYARDWLTCLKKKNCGETVEQEAQTESEKADPSGLRSPAAVKASEFLAVLKEIKGGFEEKSAEEYLHAFLNEMLKETGENQYKYWGEDPVLRLNGANDRASWSKFHSKTSAWTYDNETTRSLEGTIAPNFVRQQDKENFETLKKAVEGFGEVANLFQTEKDHTGLSVRANQWLACIESLGNMPNKVVFPTIANPLPNSIFPLDFTLLNSDIGKEQELIPNSR